MTEEPGAGRSADGSGSTDGSADADGSTDAGAGAGGSARSPVRVLMLNYEYPPLGGGAATACAHLLKEYSRHFPGIQVDLVTSALGAGRVESPAPGITLHFLDIGKRDRPHFQSNRDLLAYTFRAGRYLRRLLARNRYDLCHAFFGIPCGFVARRTGLPYLVSLRGSDVPFYNPRFYWPDRLLFRRLSRGIWREAAAVVANSAGLRRLALETAPDQPIEVIPNGIDTGTFHPGDAPGREGGAALRVLSVGRLIPRKRMDTLIRAAALLPPGSVELTIAGDGPERGALERLVAELGLRDRVRLTGRLEHDRLPALYREHDLFAMVSLNEGMSNTVLEALASGLPVVLSDTGGTAELLEHGENGLLLEQRADAESVAAALRVYTERPDLLAEHGRRSRLRAEAMSWTATAAAYAGLYRRILERGDGR